MAELWFWKSDFWLRAPCSSYEIAQNEQCTMEADLGKQAAKEDADS